MQEERLKGYLGLATKAGKLITGYNTCLEMIPRGKLKLVILAKDVGEKTKKKIEQKCISYEIPFMIGIGAEEMSKACGKRDKGVFGITDNGFAKVIIGLLSQDNKGKETETETETGRKGRCSNGNKGA